MGILKDNINLDLQYAFLFNLGFTYGKNSGARGETGYTKIIHHSTNECLWITVNPIEKKVYLYNEMDIGGMLWEGTIDIPISSLKNEKTFVDWLDEKIEDTKQW